MNARYQFCAGKIAIVILQQEFPSFLIQRRFRIGVDQQTLDRHEYVGDPEGRLPILL